ncbi:hypothetical protein FHU41_002682 [Psychromicrobium silvestre]|uniref:Uncharacterized protein n=1 Tax=Psychromicrobium silvestre TaxID=1645614 RepID=A0A7Y9LVL2_9MICC|nr:hypothetical protein [Psychromicrobium silvestre]NYE96432.1 hypothetical protein [Psychromicrobium silvestre]
MLAAFASLPAKIMFNDAMTNTMVWGLIIAGALMIGSAFLPRLKTGQRVAAVIFGVLFLGYGIYVSLPSTTDIFISAYMFIVPFAVLVTNLSAAFKKTPPVQVENHGPAGYYPQGQPGAQPDPSQAYPAQGQAYSAQQYPAQAYPAQPNAGQQYPSQPYPTQNAQAAPNVQDYQQPYLGQNQNQPYPTEQQTAQQPTDPTA